MHKLKVLHTVTYMAKYKNILYIPPFSCCKNFTYIKVTLYWIIKLCTLVVWIETRARHTVLRDRLKTAREGLATRGSTLEELEEEVEDLRKENDKLLSVADIPTDTEGMDVSEPSDQEDDDMVASEKDPEEILFDGDSAQE